MRRPGARRVLIVEPDGAVAAATASTLAAAGLEPTIVADADEGLRALAALAPELVILELDLHGRDGRWLLRRLRDDYMGGRPRVVVATSAQALGGGVADLGVDAVVLKPAPLSVLASAALADRADGIDEPGRLRELVRLSLLAGDLQGAVEGVARRLALTFRAANCLVVAHVGERRVTGLAAPAGEGWDTPAFWDVCRLAIDLAVPLVASVGGGLASFLGVPLEPPGGPQLGFVVLFDDRGRFLPFDGGEALRALAGRLYGELAWRTVHERIASDRDRLRESSMLDPMLAGVWTRAALDQRLAADVAACQRRGEPIAFVVADLRGLKQLNERHGHVVGDGALRHVAAIVRGAVRGQDLVARYTGDALAIVLPGTSVSDARRVVERIQDALAATPLIVGDDLVPLALVAGIADLADDDDTGEGALGRATAAVMAAKRRRERLAMAEAGGGDDPAGAAATAPAGLEGGVTLGGMYQILHEISRGAMGVVYRAEDLGLGRPVALKTLRPDLARDRSFVERFRAEAATLAALRHEHLVQVYAFGIDGDDVYFVMELVEGEPLEDRVELARHERRLIPFDELARVIVQIASALDAMHAAGIVHRDVKPSNILIDRVRDRAVLVDVGIAKRRGSEMDPAGTPGYTAPESFTDVAEGPASDVYGLAATAYTLLTTEAPFRGGTVEEILRRQLAEPPSPPSGLRPGLQASVDAVLRRSLDPDPTRRHPSARALADALVAALAEAPAHVRAGLDWQAEVRSDGESSLEPELVATSVPWPGTGGRTAVEGLSSTLVRATTGTTTRGASAGTDPAGDGRAGGVPRAVTEEPTDKFEPSRHTPRPWFADGDAAAESRVDATRVDATPVIPSLHDAPISGPGELVALGGEAAVERAGWPRAPADGGGARPGESLSSGVPHTRGVLFRSSHRVLGARHAAAWVAQLARRNPALGQALQPQSTLSWHPTELFIELLRGVTQTGRDAAVFARELGRAAATATFGRFFGADPAALTPWRVLSAADLFWRRYHTWGVVAAERQDATSARVHVAEGPRERLVCATTAGLLEQVAVLAGAARVEVEHPACEGDGAVTCEFIVRWHLPTA